MGRNKQDPKVIEPPGDLNERLRALWRDVVPRRARSPERLMLLQTALEALDRCDEVRAAIREAGLTTTTKTPGALHLHPLLRVEKEARQQFLAAWD